MSVQDSQLLQLVFESKQHLNLSFFLLVFHFLALSHSQLMFRLLAIQKLSGAE